MKKVESMDFPLFVKWYITQRCNLRCTHCYLTDYTKSPELSEIVPIIDHLGGRGVFGIVLIGGEPVVRNDLAEIVKRISEHGIRTKIATNATLIDAAKARDWPMRARANIRSVWRALSRMKTMRFAAPIRLRRRWRESGR
ncbi:MAG TPA: radical SAM protein [Burkholderia sp.]|nr:radical SAM protein [Burkholderia sp.]